jgi:hypothetical protein
MMRLTVLAMVLLPIAVGRPSACRRRTIRIWSMSRTL